MLRRLLFWIPLELCTVTRICSLSPIVFFYPLYFIVPCLQCLMLTWHCVPEHHKRCMVVFRTRSFSIAILFCPWPESHHPIFVMMNECYVLHHKSDFLYHEWDGFDLCHQRYFFVIMNESHAFSFSQSVFPSVKWMRVRKKNVIIRKCLTLKKLWLFFQSQRVRSDLCLTSTIFWNYESWMSNVWCPKD